MHPGRNLVLLAGHPVNGQKNSNISSYSYNRINNQNKISIKLYVVGIISIFIMKLAPTSFYVKYIMFNLFHKSKSCNTDAMYVK